MLVLLVFQCLCCRNCHCGCRCLGGCWWNSCRSCFCCCSCCCFCYCLDSCCCCCSCCYFGWYCFCCYCSCCSCSCCCYCCCCCCQRSQKSTCLSGRVTSAWFDLFPAEIIPTLTSRAICHQLKRSRSRLQDGSVVATMIARNCFFSQTSRFFLRSPTDGVARIFHYNFFLPPYSSAWS